MQDACSGRPHGSGYILTHIRRVDIHQCILRLPLLEQSCPDAAGDADGIVQAARALRSAGWLKKRHFWMACA